MAGVAPELLRSCGAAPYRMSESESDLSSDDLSAETASWIAWFCSIRGNEFFCQVDEEYITDSFNLSGLKEEVPYYDMAVETILDGEHPSMNEMTEAQQEAVDSAAELLYGLIHARFIITAKGLTLMVRVGCPGWQGSWRRPAQATASLLPSLPTRSLSPLPSSPPPPPTTFHAPPRSCPLPIRAPAPLQNEKFLECSFGQCANYLCGGQALLPVAIHDQPRKSNVHLYCPRCNGVFHPPSSRHGSELGPRCRSLPATAPSLPLTP